MISFTRLATRNSSPLSMATRSSRRGRWEISFDGDRRVVRLHLTPKGRNETGPHFNLTDWVRHHDQYDSESFDFMEAYQRDEGSDACCSSQEARS